MKKMMMKTFITALVLPLAVLSVHAANWYVRPNSTGSNNGRDWNNAWTTSTINWASVQPGDTLWLAGGTYTGMVNINKSGSAGNYIYIKRVLSTDSAPTAAAGWNPSFDSQVVFNTSIAFRWFGLTDGTGSYIYIDGRKDSGIQANATLASSGPVGAIQMWGGDKTHDCVFTNLDINGPGWNMAYPADQYGFVFFPSGSNPVGHLTNMVVAASRIHNYLGSMDTVRTWGITMDHCQLYDLGNNGTGAAHMNVWQWYGCGNVTMRNCTVSNWVSEGISISEISGPLYMSGCVWTGTRGAGVVLWPNNGPSGTGAPYSQGPVYLYNNVFNGVYLTTSQGKSVPFTAGSQARNNIYWNSSWYSAYEPSDMDYEFSNTSINGAHSINIGANPFVNSSQGDFHIVSTIGPNYPRNKGVAIPSLTQTDVDGTVRGADGAWDIGAYEYPSVLSTNPVLLVSPASLNFGSVPTNTSSDLTFTVQNAGGGTLAGKATLASTNNGFTIVSGATYSLDAGQSQSVTVRFSPSAPGSATNSVTFTGGGGAGASVIASGVSAAATLGEAGSSFAASAGTIAAPFDANGGAYLSQPAETGVSDGGRAVYDFTTLVADNYSIYLNVNAPNQGANSIYVNVDAEPQDPSMVWDIPLTTGFEWRRVGWRGNGSFDNPQYTNKEFNLSAGKHQLIIRGREANTQVARISISLSPPQKVRVLPAVAGP